MNSRRDSKPKPNGAASGRRVRIVIADDDSIILDHLTTLLETRFDVLGRAQNGRELVQMVHRLLPDIVVTDVTMPEMNGIDAARQIKKTRHNVKVIMLSGYCDPALIEGSLAAGASGYVVKLRVFEELIPAIQVVFSGQVYWPADVWDPPTKTGQASG